MASKINKVFQIFLNIFAFGLFAFVIVYWVNLLSNNLWDDKQIRIIIMVLTIGAVSCAALARIIRNQDRIIKQLENHKHKETK